MFDAIRVTRETDETRFEIVLEPRRRPMDSLPIPNRLLSHFIDHFSRAAGINVVLSDVRWPGSWRFDHVLCEDMGQLVGRGLAEIHDRRSATEGVRGRALAVSCMDDAESEVVVSFEQRPRVGWSVPPEVDIDGFVDSWYDEAGRMEGQASGTNLRQFLDGLALGSGASVSVSVRRCGNLHHLYETVFRGLGDAVGSALGTGEIRLAGDTSGLARACRYTVRGVDSVTPATRTVILDADGVFLGERPYWNAALGAALQRAGLADLVEDRWTTFSDVAFGSLGLHRVTKSVGCNSNWDLAAVLARALEDEDVRTEVGAKLATPWHERETMETLRAGALRLLDPSSDDSDPLLRFGVDRRSRFYGEIVELFQGVFHRDTLPGWLFQRSQLKESREVTETAFESLRDAGCTLRVCTGRHRAEIEAPIRDLGLTAHLAFRDITSADEVDRAEAMTGLSALGKPHAFAPACATIGFDAALSAVERGTRVTGAAVYVGDAWADFRAVDACRALGLDMAYVHVRSGVTTDEQERTIAGTKGTLEIVSSLAELPRLLTGVAS